MDAGFLHDVRVEDDVGLAALSGTLSQSERAVSPPCSFFLRQFQTPIKPTTHRAPWFIAESSFMMPSIFRSGTFGSPRCRQTQGGTSMAIRQPAGNSYVRDFPEASRRGSLERIVWRMTSPSALCIGRASAGVLPWVSAKPRAASSSAVVAVQ